MIEPEFFARHSVVVARDLIGMTLLVGGVGGPIVEVEAYDHQDPASHTFNGPTERNASMFGPPGHAYVYRSYGLHWCLNFVCGAGLGDAVLLRALEPAQGLDIMGWRRGLQDRRLLCAGPGRLTQALGITGEHDGLRLDRPPFEIQAGLTVQSVIDGPRIGIRKGVETPWRFGLEGSPFLSRPFR